MSPVMAVSAHNHKGECHKGVKQLVDSGLQRVPKKYILSPSERPATNMEEDPINVAKQNLQLPIIDFSDLLGPNRPQVLQNLAAACEGYGFFQVSNRAKPLTEISFHK